jgi:uncharacterized protein
MDNRPACERCNAPTPVTAVAFICSYECTWCEACAADFAFVCPNCGGELLRRPRRAGA